MGLRSGLAVLGAAVALASAVSSTPARAEWDHFRGGYEQRGGYDWGRNDGWRHRWEHRRYEEEGDGYGYGYRRFPPPRAYYAPPPQYYYYVPGY